MTDLRPCPFCDGKTRIVHTSSINLMNVPNGVVVSCETPGCMIDGPWDLGKSGAIERWNTRPIEDELRYKLKEALEIAHEAIRCIDKSQPDLIRLQIKLDTLEGGE